MNLSRIKTPEPDQIDDGLRAMLTSIAGQEVVLQHPKDEAEEPAFLAEDFTHRATSVWVQQNIQGN